MIKTNRTYAKEQQLKEKKEEDGKGEGKEQEKIK